MKLLKIWLQAPRQEIMKIGSKMAFFHAFVYLLLGIYLLNSFLPPIASSQAWLYTFILAWGHFAFLAMIPWILSFLLPLLFPSKKIMLPLWVLFYFIFSGFFVADVFVYSLMRLHLNTMMFAMVFEQGHVFNFSWRMKFLMLFIALFLLLLTLTFAWLSQKRWLNPWWIRGFLGFSFLLFLTGNLWHAVAYFSENKNIIELDAPYPFVPRLTSTKFFKKHHFISQKTIEENRKHFALKKSITSGSIKHYPTEPLRCTPLKTPPSILWLVVDTLRFDALSKRVMPKSYAYAQKNAQFLNHYSGGNATGEGVTSLTFGFSGFWNDLVQQRKGPILFSKLQKENFDIQVFFSAGIHAPEHHLVSFANLPNADQNTPNQNTAHSYEMDRDINRELIAYLKKAKKAKKPFFAFAFYDSVHAYDYPEKNALNPNAPVMNYLTLTAKSDIKPVVERYENSAHYVDSLIGEVLLKLKKLKMDKNTIVLISADHGEEHNDNQKNYWGHGSNFSPSQTHVPMIIHRPNQKHQVIKRETMHYDIAPWLLRDVLGCHNDPSTYSYGYPIFDSNAPKRAFLLISDYEQYALLLPEKNLIWTQKKGLQYYEITDLHLNPLKHPDFSQVDLSKLLELKTRFH